MLIQLSIRDIVLIEKLDIRFEKGLSIFTGETGAGKSILLDSLSLALGERGDGALIRRGADKGEVSAVFEVPKDHIARRLLIENAIEDDGDIILKRIQMADGRSRAFVNDKVVTIGFLKEIGKYLVEIHGQYGDRTLMDVEAHRLMLDNFAGLQQHVTCVQNYYHFWYKKKQEFLKQKQRIEEAKRERSYLEASIEELSMLNPQQGEEDELCQRRAQMMHAEKIASEIYEAYEVLDGSHSPFPILSSLSRRLERKSADFSEFIVPITEALNKALEALSLVQENIETAKRTLNFDPRDLEQVEERLFALRGASRKYQVPIDDLKALKERYESDLAALDAGEALLEKTAREILEAEETYDQAALQLSEQRQIKAKEFQNAILHELPDLKLERANFIIKFSTNPLERRPNGIDDIEFWVQTNPDTEAGPLMKIASGGELSRFLLALKVALADKSEVPSLIFDEIDTGIGGAVADAIGKKFYRLAEKLQIVSITHAPQVAARAHTHFLISKNQCDESKSTKTHIRILTAQEKNEEIARMLSGSVITEEARAAAQKLIAQQ